MITLQKAMLIKIAQSEFSAERCYSKDVGLMYWHILQ